MLPRHRQHLEGPDLPYLPRHQGRPSKIEYTLSMCVCSQTTVDVQYVRLKAWTLLSLEKRRRSCDFLLVF